MFKFLEKHGGPKHQPQEPQEPQEAREAREAREVAKASVISRDVKWSLQSFLSLGLVLGWVRVSSIEYRISNIFHTTTSEG